MGPGVGRAETIQATIEGVWWHEDPEVKGNLKARIADVMAGYRAGLGPADREQWFLLVRERLVPEYHTAWTRLAGYEVAKPHRIRRGRAKDT